MANAFIDPIAGDNESDLIATFSRYNEDPLKDTLNPGFEQIERTEREIEHIQQRLTEGKLRRAKSVPWTDVHSD
jgi:hypothetical protein